MVRLITVRRLVLTLCITFVAGLAYTQDFESLRQNNWHQWRGPDGNGFVPNGNPPITWDENTNIKWKTPIPGEGSATPIIWNDQLFIVTAVKTDRVKESAAQEQGGGRGIRAPSNYYKFIVMCLDKNTGKVIWEKTAAEEVPPAGHHQTGSYAAGSPTTDGTRLYVTFGSIGIFCYDLKGNFLWKTDLGDMQTRMSFGEGASPVWHGDSLVVNWDHENQSFIACLDTKSGDIRWKVDRDERTTWSTPLITEYRGTTQIIVPGENNVISYNLTDGSVIWTSDGLTGNAVPTPLRYKDNVICTSGFRGAAMDSIPLGSKGKVTPTWSYDKNTPYVPTPLLYGNKLYFFRVNTPTMSIVDANDGTPLLEAEKLPIGGTIYASSAGAAGRVYICTRDGETLVIKHSDTLDVLATNKLDEEFDASPVIIGKQLFLRGESHLYCIEEQ
jgi:outer membrane protein assembly factor BamB